MIGKVLEEAKTTVALGCKRGGRQSRTGAMLGNVPTSIRLMCFDVLLVLA